MGGQDLGGGNCSLLKVLFQ